MAREFVLFDENVIEKELGKLKESSKFDLAKLEFCTRYYQQLDPKKVPSPAINSSDKGNLELRHKKGFYKARLLYCESKVPKGTEELVMLLVFRKDSQNTPKAMINLKNE
jgi:hypothetical protein